MALPKVSVAVVAYNEEKDIRACLDSLAALDYPKDLFDVTVVDNASTDRTREIVGEYSARDPRFRVVVNPVRGIGHSRNVALREARHDLLAFTDADCTVEPDWLTKLAGAYAEARAEDPAVAAAGGSNVAPKDSNRFRQAVAVAVTTFWGNHGSVQGKIMTGRTFVEHLPTLNVLYDRKAVLELGGFDAGMGNISEDVDLSYRLRWAGKKLLYVPDCAVRHVWRTDYASWCENMVVYGKGRSWLMKKDRRFFKPMNLAPLGLIACVVIPLFWPFVVLHALLTALAAAWACSNTGRWDLLPDVFLVYLATHYSYGVGEVVGLVQPRGFDVKRLNLR